MAGKQNKLLANLGDTSAGLNPQQSKPSCSATGPITVALQSCYWTQMSIKNTQNPKDFWQDCSKKKEVLPLDAHSSSGSAEWGPCALFIFVGGLSQRVTKSRTKILPVHHSKPGLKGTSGAEKPL